MTLSWLTLWNRGAACCCWCCCGCCHDILGAGYAPCTGNDSEVNCCCCGGGGVRDRNLIWICLIGSSSAAAAAPAFQPEANDGARAAAGAGANANGLQAFAACAGEGAALWLEAVPGHVDSRPERPAGCRAACGRSACANAAAT